MKPPKYGARSVLRMYHQINVLRLAIRSEGTPKIQEAWDSVEEHVDFVYSKYVKKDTKTD